MRPAIILSLIILAGICGGLYYAIFKAKKKWKKPMIFKVSNAPAPYPSESADKFIPRCIDDPAMQEVYPELNHRINVCSALWRAHEN